MRGVKLVTVVVVVALSVAGAALAGRGDPQERFTHADQTRAKAMLLRPSDFSVAFVALPSSSGGNDGFYCAAIDESDLTLTGRASSPNFTAQTEYVTSTGYVYASRSDSNASWRRGASKAGEQCLRLGVRAELQGAARLVSFERLAFPRRGDRSIAYRAVASQAGIRVYIDVVALQVGRAQAAVIYGSALTPPPQGELRRVTAVVATRAQKAMRGA